MLQAFAELGYCFELYELGARKKKTPSFELFVRESLVTILEHQSEAQGNKDNTKALILPGGDSHMEWTGMRVGSLRGVNFGFWSHLGRSG